MPDYPRNNLPNYPLFENPLLDRFLPELAWGPDFVAVARGLRENGFAVVNFPDPDFDAMAAGLIERLGNSNSPEAEANASAAELLDAWRTDDGVKEIACHSAIVYLLRVVYGRKVFPFQTCNFAAGVEQPFCTDTVRYHSRPERFLCGVWLALEDVDEDNGPLMYIPGSHKWPIYTNDQLGVDFSGLQTAPDISCYEELWRDLVEVSEVEPRYLHLKRGQCFIYAGNLSYAGSKPAEQSRSRWSQLTRYFFNDCAYWNPLHSDTGRGQFDYFEPVNIATGEKVVSTYLGKALAAG